MTGAQDLKNALPLTGEVKVLAPARGMFMWRKALEITFSGTGTKVTMITDKDPKPDRRKTEPKLANGEILVKAEGKSYAEITRESGKNTQWQLKYSNSTATEARRATTC